MMAQVALTPLFAAASFHVPGACLPKGSCPRLAEEQTNNQKDKQDTKQRGERDVQGSQETDNKIWNSSAVAQASHRSPPPTSAPITPASSNETFIPGCACAAEFLGYAHLLC